MDTTTTHDDFPEPEPQVLPDGRISLYSVESEATVTLDIDEIEALHAKLDEARAKAKRRAMTDGLRQLATWLDQNPDAHVGYSFEESPDVTVGPRHLSDAELTEWADKLGITVTTEPTANDAYVQTRAFVEFSGGVRYGYETVRSVERDAEVSK